MHGWMVCINYSLHVRIICYTGVYFSLWGDGWLCALYLWLSILHGRLMSLWSVFVFVASLSPYMSTFLQFYNLWYCDWLHTTLLEIEMDPTRFHPKSIDGLPCQEFMRWFVFAIVVLLSNYDVHLLRFIFEISWQGIYLRYEEICVYTSRDLWHEVLLLSYYDVCSCLFHWTF